ncbi:MAG: helix-turn-helix domain-containing protein [Rhizobiaceae bacterium]
MTGKILSRSQKRGVRHFVYEWRKHRRLTQERLAELADLTPGAISQLETGTVAYTQPTLEALAEALGCRPGDMLLVDPLTNPPRPMLAELMAAAEDMPDTFLTHLLGLMSKEPQDGAPPPKPPLVSRDRKPASEKSN